MTGIVSLPEQASTLAESVDRLFLFLLGSCAFMVLFLTVLIVGFAVVYRRGAIVERSAETKEGLEYFWIGGLLLLFLLIFGWAARLYIVETTPPDMALEIYGIGKQWMWKFQHPTGHREINDLHLPVGAPVRLVLTTQDVIHSFYVPAFRIKQDVVPGRYTTTWFTPTRVGTFHLFCAEYCGLNHSSMGGSVMVVEPAEYEAWLSHRGNTQSMAEQGRKLFQSFGCFGCHGTGSQVHAPSLAGLFGMSVRLADGNLVTADENYFRNSILFPDRQVVAGYDPIMPSFAGRLAEEDLSRIIAYIKSLSPQDNH